MAKLFAGKTSPPYKENHMKQILAVALLLASFASAALAEGSGPPPSGPAGPGQGPVDKP